jgi:hypothetical protein
MKPRLVSSGSVVRCAIGDVVRARDASARSTDSAIRNPQSE